LLQEVRGTDWKRKMIKKLRIKFIFISLASVATVFLLIMSVIFAINYKNVVERADMLLDVLSSNMGDFPVQDKAHKRRPGFTPETPYETRFFWVKLDDDGNVTDTNTKSIKALDEDEIEKYAKDAYKESDKGFINSYRYQKSETDGEILVVFVDCTRDLQMFKDFVVTGIFVCVLGLFLVFWAVFFLSKLALSPVERAMERQKRFITNVSHELKTPLTVIDASIEVIEMENGGSKWTENAKEQVVRLRDLCEHLVELSRFDEKGLSQFAWFDMSELTESLALWFETPIQAQNRQLVLNIEKGIKLNGDKKAVTRLIDQLMDNAVKYSEGDGDITVSLTKSGSKVVLEVSNPSSVPEGEHDEFFERFWRRDESRSDRGSYGIGLSAVSMIAEEHHGRVSAVSDGKTVKIKIVL